MTDEDLQFHELKVRFAVAAESTIKTWKMVHGLDHLSSEALDFLAELMAADLAAAYGVGRKEASVKQ